MMIYGLSQTSGVERTLDVQRTEAGVRLQARDAKGGEQLAYFKGGFGQSQIVATSDRGENRANPQIPWPEVQPEA